MRERLIEAMVKASEKFDEIDCTPNQAIEILADYLLANGVIIPPCKVGDKVYYISFNKVYEGKCHAITIHNILQIHLYDYDGDNASYPASKVFLTKEEAENALKARERV